MANTVTRDPHLLSRNLKLNDNYISNDGDNEGIKINDAGVITIVFSGLDLYQFNDADFRVLSQGDSDDYFKIAVAPGASGATTISTVTDDGNNAANLTFNIDGDITFNPGANKDYNVTPATKTASTAFDTTLNINETLNLSSGAGGSDVHYGIRYRQTQTDLTGWDSVYLMHLYGGSADKTFSVDSNGNLSSTTIDINDTATTTTTNKGLHVDIDSSGALGSGSQTLTNIGLDLDINRASTLSHASCVVNQTGIDVDIVGDPDGTATNTGLDINLSGNATGDTNKGIVITLADADTNYALITSGGNVGIGVSDPDFSLEILSTSNQLKLSYDATNYFKANTQANGLTTFSTFDADGHSANMILDVDGGLVLDPYDGVVKFQKAGDLDDLCTLTVAADGATTIATADSDGAVGHLTLAIDGHVEFDGCGVGFDQVTASFDATNTTVDFTTGNKQHLTLTADVTNLFFKFPATSGNFLCVVLQDGTGGWNVTNFKGLDSAGAANANGSLTDGGIRWAGGSAPALTETADKADILTFYWDATGANEIAYGIASENF